MMKRFFLIFWLHFLPSTHYNVLLVPVRIERTERSFEIRKKLINDVLRGNAGLNPEYQKISREHAFP